MTTKINDLKINQNVWYFTKYGDLNFGKIYSLKPNDPHPCGTDFGVYDSVGILVEKGRGTNKFSSRCEVCAKQTMIYTSKPNQKEFVDDSVDFESTCECGGTINGKGWCNDSGEIVQFGYQECDSCEWNQAS